MAGWRALSRCRTVPKKTLQVSRCRAELPRSRLNSRSAASRVQRWGHRWSRPPIQRHTEIVFDNERSPGEHVTMDTIMTDASASARADDLSLDIWTQNA